MNIPQNFLELSSKLGNDFNLVQGAGGNISIKTGETMFVKASGTSLKDALMENIFVSVELSEPVFSNSFPYFDGLKPSIETSLHLLMPQKVVAHIHSLSVISVGVLKDAKAHFNQILQGLNWLMVPYIKPGVDLAKSVHQAIKGFDDTVPDIIILGNHGLVVGGDTVPEVHYKINEIEKRIKPFLRKSPSLEFKLPSVACSPPGFVPVKHEGAHIPAFDKAALKYVVGGTLYPDHIVFLRRSAIVIETSRESLEYCPSDLVYIRNVGAFLPIDANDIAHEMAHALGLVGLKIPLNSELNYLTRDEEDQLLDWDAEHYRQRLANKKIKS